MELYQRLKNAMDEGSRMCELNRHYLYMRDTLWDYLHNYNSSARYDKPEIPFSSTDYFPGRIYGNIGLDACCEKLNELGDKRRKRVSAYYTEGISELELFVENFGYVLGYKIENVRRGYRDLARSYDIWKYNRRRLKAREKGWDAHQFFENEVLLGDKEKAMRLTIYEKEREKQRRRLNKIFYL